MDLGMNVKANVGNAVESFKSLGTEVNKMAGTFKRSQEAIRATNTQMTNLNKDGNRASNSMLNLNNSSAKLFKTLRAGVAIGAFAKLSSALMRFSGNHINSAMNAIETNNLFEVSFGETASAIEDSLIRISDASGLNLTNLKNSSGTYVLLARSMGMNSEQASTLSMNMTRLALDLSSLMNVPIEQAMGDLRSGLLGQSETVYKYGIDVTEASIAQEALNIGINKSVREMSQGEKMYLRQIVILKHTSLAHGDFARTIEQPANQIKILKMRFQTLSETIGKLFVPVLQWVLPYLNALAIVVNRVAMAIGRFFGIDMSKKTVDSTKKLAEGFNNIKPNVNKASKEIDKVKNQIADLEKKSAKPLKKVSSKMKKVGKDAKKAGEEIKKAGKHLLGIDEINTLGKDEDKSKLDDPTKDLDKSLGDLKIPELDKANPKLDALKAKLADLMGGFDDGLNGIFGGLPLDAFENGLEDIKTKADEIAESMLNWIKHAKDMIVNHLPQILSLVGAIAVALLLWKISGFIGSLGGLKGMLGGLAKSFLPFVGFALVVFGLYLAFQGLYEIITQAKPPLDSFIKLFVGLSLAIYGVGLMFGVALGWLPLLIAGIVVVLLAIWKYKDEIIAFLQGLWEWIKQAFAIFVEAMITWFANLGLLIWNILTGIIEIIIAIVTGLVHGIEAVFNFLKAVVSFIWNEIIMTIVDAVVGFVLFVVDAIVGFVKSVVDKFNELRDKANVIWLLIVSTIKNFILSLVNNAIEKFNMLKEFFSNLMKAIKDVFKAGWDAVKKFFTETIPKIVKSVVDWFGELAGKIKKKLDNAIAKVKEWVTGMWNFIKIEIPKLINNIRDFFGELAGKIKQKLSDALDKVKEWGRNVWNFITVDIPRTIRKIVDFFGEIAGKIKQKFDNALAKVKEWASSVWNYITIEIPKIIGDIVGFFGGLAGKVWDKLTNVITKIKEWIGDTSKTVIREIPKIIGDIVGFFAELPSKIFNKIKEFGNIFGDIGKHMLDGIFGGFGKIGGRIADWGKGVVGGVKSFFGIKSPSRLMASVIGLPLAQGVGVGLTSGSSFIVDRAKGLSEDLSGAFSDVTMTAGVKYKVGDMGGLPADMSVGVSGSISNTSSLDTSGMNDGMYSAVFNAVTSAMSSDQRGDIVLKVGNSELGRIAIKSINNVTKQEGRLLLDV